MTEARSATVFTLGNLLLRQCQKYPLVSDHCNSCKDEQDLKTVDWYKSHWRDYTYTDSTKFFNYLIYQSHLYQILAELQSTGFHLGPALCQILEEAGDKLDIWHTDVYHHCAFRDYPGSLYKNWT